MKLSMSRAAVVLVAVAVSVSLFSVSLGRGAAAAGDRAEAASRGKLALEAKSHISAMWPTASFDRAWECWSVESKPADYDAAFRNRYGLHPAPYDNDGLPMGLRRAPGSKQSGIAIDCMLCHGGSILGKSYVGLPNSSLDLVAVFDELPRAVGRTSTAWPFPLARSRGVTNAAAVAAFVASFRNPDLSPRFPPAQVDWTIFPDLDPPAWWLWKRKQTIYCDASTDARSTRSAMQFLLGATTAADKIKSLEPTWNDVREYLWSLEPPKYPFEIHQQLASAGETLFRKTCARCHGTYGPDGRYPNKVVPIDVIGTDRARLDINTAEFREHYNSGWFGEKYPAIESVGYQAPPLDGVWATAPYFHNGSVPTVYHVLNSAARPARFRRSFSTDAGAFDTDRLGWKFELVAAGATFDDLAPAESRRLYDSTRFGRGNGGHTFGDHLTDDERRAVIEFLKTL